MVSRDHCSTVYYSGKLSRENTFMVLGLSAKAFSAPCHPLIIILVVPTCSYP